MENIEDILKRVEDSLKGISNELKIIEEVVEEDNLQDHCPSVKKAREQIDELLSTPPITPEV